MRKATIFLALLLALSVGGAVYLSEAAYATRDQVSVAATHHYGDETAIEGAKLTLHAMYDYRLFWDVDYDFTTQSVTDTQYRYEPRRTYEMGKSNFYGVSMYAESEYILDYEAEENELCGWARMTREAVEATPNGTEKSHVFRLADYLEYYEFSLSVDLPVPISHTTAHNAGWMPEAEQKVADEIRDFFKIRVLENEYVEIMVGKDENGNVYSMGSGSLGTAYPVVGENTSASIAPEANISETGDWYSPWQNNAVTEDACFFIMEGTASNGTLVDFSAVPGGYGIYCVPYEDPTYGPNGEMTDTGIRSDELAMVYALPQDIKVIHFIPSADGSRLLLFTTENEECILTVIDTKTFETLQRFAICDYPEEGWVWIHEEENFFVAVAENYEGFSEYTLVLPDESGDYYIEFTVDAGLEHDPSAGRNSDTFMVYDGEKLLRVALLYEADPFYLETCSFSAKVYDKTGLLYCGEYQSNFTESIDLFQNRYAITPTQYKPLEVSW